MGSLAISYEYIIIMSFMKGGEVTTISRLHPFTNILSRLNDLNGNQQTAWTLCLALIRAAMEGPFQRPLRRLEGAAHDAIAPSP